MTCPTCDAPLADDAECIHCQPTGQSAGLAPPPEKRAGWGWMAAGAGLALVLGAALLGPQTMRTLAARQHGAALLAQCDALCPGGHAQAHLGSGLHHRMDPDPPDAVDRLEDQLDAACCTSCDIDVTQESGDFVPTPPRRFVEHYPNNHYRVDLTGHMQSAQTFAAARLCPP